LHTNDIKESSTDISGRVPENLYSVMVGYSDLPCRCEGYDPSRCFIYKLSNKKTGKCYVGVSMNPRGRIHYHHRMSQYPIGHAFRKHGVGAFVVEILLVATEDECYAQEPRFIEQHNALNTNGGYNIDLGGSRPPRMAGKDSPQYGKHLSEETKQKIREARSRQHASEWHLSLGDRTRGSGNINAKLTEDQVAQIKQRVFKESGIFLAREFGVSNCAILDIKMGRTWRHVKAPPQQMKLRLYR
jgi:group I intron endonuclease